MRDRTALERTKAAIHQARENLEGDDKTIVWHMIADIIEWCAAQSPRVDFDLLVSEAHEHISNEAYKC